VTKPFVLQLGVHAGKSLERLMFTDPRYVSVLATAGNRYAGWLIKRGEDRVGPVCTGCGQADSRYLVFYRQRVDDDFTILPGAYCDKCAREHKNLGRTVMSLGFSATLWPRRKIDQIRIAKHISEIFALKGASDEKLFRFFRESGSSRHLR